MNDEFSGMWKEAAVALSGHSLDIWLVTKENGENTDIAGVLAAV